MRKKLPLKSYTRQNVTFKKLKTQGSLSLKSSKKQKQNQVLSPLSPSTSATS